MSDDLPDKKPSRVRSLKMIDMQAGGDVSRIVLSGVEALPGKTVHEQQLYLEANGDGLRRLLLSEPYGDPAMSVNLIVRPCNPDAEAGYIIMEAMGYPMYSGSNTICTATALLQSGRIPIEDSQQTVLLESPAGIARVQARCANGFVQSVTTQGEAAYLAVPDLEAEVPRYGRVRYNVVWSGGFYAMIDAQALGFQLVRDEEPALAAFADAFVKTVRPEFIENHPEFDDVTPLPFVHFMRTAHAVDGGFRARGATYVHPGVICRSPTGTGTSARIALMAERGQIREGQWLETLSPRDSSFIGTLLGQTTVNGQRGWDTHITGRAWTLTRSRVEVELDDPLVDTADLENVLVEPG
ncbi:proline racemase family protein [Salinisphaera sp. LB1]|uniref:proline racemase family protein n=1 Tax=Salinisphaera sp. LB1 TaxID=2183911 RepID=UPI000D706E65|nr:proline racemase family protein [Salinisphaera sp. LB1]AWN14490.1 2-methylaconitate racemase [Salinisphaera sp. LB1]